MTLNATLTGAAGSTLVIRRIKRLHIAKETVCVKKCYAELFPGSVISFLRSVSETSYSPSTGRQRGEVPG